MNYANEKRHCPTVQSNYNAATKQNRHLIPVCIVIPFLRVRLYNKLIFGDMSRMELKAIESGIVPVYQTDTGEKIVYGTELHKTLEVKTDFSTWVKRRLDECDAEENKDYQTCSSNLGNKNHGGQNKKEYIIKLNTAKEMAMLERNEKGKQVRRYFISVEKKYKEIATKGHNVKQLTISSMEVAQMVGKEHYDLLKDIRRYVEQLGEGKIPQSDFFTESTYQNSQNKTMPCFNVTKKGCEFIAHKLAGAKGTAFTARYINRFHEMESNLANINMPEEMLLQLSGFIQQQLELNQKMMNQLEMIESRKNNNIYEGFYQNCIGEKSQIEERKEHLYRQVAEASELYGQSQTSILHNLYCALEKLLGIDLDSYKLVYRSETGNKKAGMIEVIAANDRLYEKAVYMNDYVLERI